jgi:hypothetical protein
MLRVIQIEDGDTLTIQTPDGVLYVDLLSGGRLYVRGGRSHDDAFAGRLDDYTPRQLAAGKAESVIFYPTRLRAVSEAPVVAARIVAGKGARGALRADWNPLYRMYLCEDGLMRTPAELEQEMERGAVVAKGGPLA